MVNEDSGYEAYAEHPEGMAGAYRDMGLEPNSHWYTQARVDELVREAGYAALMAYADDLAANDCAVAWFHKEFVSDVRTYARDLYGVTE